LVAEAFVAAVGWVSAATAVEMTKDAPRTAGPASRAFHKNFDIIFTPHS